MAVMAPLLAGCAITDVASPPQATIQVRISREAIAFNPGQAKAGLRLRFHVEVTDNFDHELVAEGTPFQPRGVAQGIASGGYTRDKPRDVDWAPGAPGTFQFSCAVPTHNEKGNFTVQA